MTPRPCPAPPYRAPSSGQRSNPVPVNLATNSPAATTNRPICQRSHDFHALASRGRRQPLAGLLTNPQNPTSTPIASQDAARSVPPVVMGGRHPRAGGGRPLGVPTAPCSQTRDHGLVRSYWAAGACPSQMTGLHRNGGAVLEMTGSFAQRRPERATLMLLDAGFVASRCL